MAKKKRKVLYANDATESVPLLLKIRLPWLFLGLVLSLLTAAVVSRYESVLASNAHVAFFIPLIVYLSDAVGTQTATIYIRNLSKKQARFSTYILKELLLGLSVGIIFGAITATVTNFWLGDSKLALAVGIALLAAITSATVFALIIAAILNKLKTDPATGADPIVTVLQDIISLMIYFYVVSLLVS
jgi:magnesium transporter